ncbi:MAG TPA: hypothetical protein VKS79_20070 [Gemmataceae bacterium]|nr:hypothetical protein [Gemmataceae bacterium]
MTTIELRDRNDARKFILQGLWLQQALYPPAPSLTKDILEWALEVANAGDSLPPVGFVADLGVETFNLDRGEKRTKIDQENLPKLPSYLQRTYEDYVLGRIYRDSFFERAGHALRKYDKKQNWARGLAFLIRQIRRHTRIPGVLLSPSILRAMRDLQEQEILDEGRRSWEKDGLMPLLETCYQSMAESFRNSAEILLEVDVRALENGVALQPESQQLAHEQVMTAAKLLSDQLPSRKLKPLVGRHEVPTRVLDEDTYPVGGYASIATHGSIESLLHSQLAYMEPAGRPDLFDIKYLRDELFYYSRDENQFLRRRRTFVFAFYPDLVEARTKDPDVPFQRIIMLLGLLYAAIGKLIEWLSDDSLKFVFVFLTDGEIFPLRHEYGLLEMLFREQMDNKSVQILPAHKEDKLVSAFRQADLTDLCRREAQRSLCHCLLMSAQEQSLDTDEVLVTRLLLDEVHPTIGGPADPAALSTDDWAPALERLLQLWI